MEYISNLVSLANILNPSSSCLGSLNVHVHYHALRLLVNTHCRTMQSRAISSTVNPRVYTKLLNRKKTFAWVMHVHTEPITRPISRTVNLENIASSLFSQGYENNYIFISLRNTAWIWMIISSLLYISPCRDFAHYLSDIYI